MENYPALVSCKAIKFECLKKIPITSERFSLGRSLSNSVVIPFLAISRNHCEFKKNDDGWTIMDNSAFGVEVNGHRLGKGNCVKLGHEDIITLEPSKEYVYKFYHPNDESDIPRKKIKLENEDIPDLDLINNVKLKFEESQTNEIKHIETKIQSTKQLQSTSIMLKEQLQVEMDKKMQNLEAEYAAQIDNLQGEKNEVERQKALLLEERDAQLTSVRQEMEAKIEDLLEQIRKNKESETELMKKNNELKEKLDKEREEFLAEINRETSSKKDIMEKLEARIREEEEKRVKEIEELQERLKNETDQLRLAKEKELKELEEQKRLRELELTCELDNIKKNLAERVEESEQQRLIAEKQLEEQRQQLRKLSDEDKAKMEQLRQEREEIERKLAEAENNAQKSVVELQQKIQQRETELATLANERIQFQAEQSSEVISCLQAQLENVKAQLQNVETEKNTLIECLDLDPGEGTSNQADKMEAVGQIMENELQCSICAEMFIEATTLNCSHTFCKYCITMWKKKKKDCPICRSPIKTECRSLVLDSFIEKMTETLSDEMKQKRQEMLQARKELEAPERPRDAHRARRGSESSSASDDSAVDSEAASGSGGGSDEEEGGDHTDTEYADFDGYYDDDDYNYDYDAYIDQYIEQQYGFRGFRDSGSDAGDSADSDSGADADAAAAAPGRPGHRAQRGHGAGGRRRHAGHYVEGIPGARYGGYGNCFVCGAAGHWAPGCPYR